MGVRTEIVNRPLLPVIPRLSPAYELKTSDPVEAAEEVAAYHGRSTAAYIDFAEAFAICWERFSDNGQKVAFLKRLADLGVISRRDAMVLARPNGMVSMIKKIGENAYWLRRSEISPLLVPEPSKLYQIVLLRGVLNDDFDLTVSKLRTLEPGYTRDEIVTLRPLPSAFGPTEHRTHGSDALSSEEPKLSHDNQVTDAPTTTPGQAMSVAANGGSVVSSGELAPQTFNLLAVRCDNRDLRRLRTDFADANELDRLLPRPLLASLSAVVVFVRISDIAVIETRLLPHLGFGRIEHVFAVGNATGPDLAHQQVALVSIRGLSCTSPLDTLSSECSPLELATHLFPQAKSKAQLFCEPVSGWISFDWSEDEA